jgi:hypothetical protein
LRKKNKIGLREKKRKGKGKGKGKANHNLIMLALVNRKRAREERGTLLEEAVNVSHINEQSRIAGSVIDYIGGFPVSEYGKANAFFRKLFINNDHFRLFHTRFIHHFCHMVPFDLLTKVHLVAFSKIQKAILPRLERFSYRDFFERFEDEWSHGSCESFIKSIITSDNGEMVKIKKILRKKYLDEHVTAFHIDVPLPILGRVRVLAPSPLVPVPASALIVPVPAIMVPVPSPVEERPPLLSNQYQSPPSTDVPRPARPLPLPESKCLSPLPVLNKHNFAIV